MKKIILLSTCVAAVSAWALPTYEPFTEYTIGNSTNAVSLAGGGLSVTTGGVTESWLSLGYSGLDTTMSPTAVGVDVTVTNMTSGNPFTATAVSAHVPGGFPGTSAAISQFAYLPSCTNKANTNGSAVGNSAVLQLSRGLVRNNTTQTIYFSYLLDIVGEAGATGEVGRFSGFLASTNVSEPSTSYSTWQSFFLSFLDKDSGAPPYISYEIHTDGGNSYFGPSDSYSSNEPANPYGPPANATTETVIKYGAVNFVVGYYIMQPVGSAAADENFLMTNPPLSSFGGPTPATALPGTLYQWCYDTNGAGNNFITDVNGFFLMSRPYATPYGESDPMYMANLLIGTTWSFVTGGPEFITQPTNVTADFGGNTSFTGVAMAAAQTVSYQWEKVTATTTNTVNNGAGGAGGLATVSGATTTNLTLAGISSGDAGSFQLVTTSSGTGFQLTSAVAVLTGITPGPVDIITNPMPAAATTNYAGVVSYTAVAQTGSPPITYAWYKGSTMMANGSQPDGSTAFGAQGTNAGASLTATLTLSNVSYLDDGSYTLYVTNSVNSTSNSAAATLTVNDPYIVTEPPTGPIFVVPGTSTNISVTALGTGVTYSWVWTNGDGADGDPTDITGATSSTLAISPAQVVDSGTYEVVVNGASGQPVTGTATVISVGAAPEITTQPSPAYQPLQLGGTTTLTVAAIGLKPITYQWYLGSTNTPIAGATNTSYALPAATNTGASVYFCVASNAYGATNSSAVTVAVLAPTSSYVSAITGDGPIAFLRLDEGPDNDHGNDGTIAYDTMGGHNGVYSNVILQVAGYSSYDTDDYAAAFGQFQDPTETNTYVDNYVGEINGINFGVTAGNADAFSVEAWVNLGNNVQNAGIVSKQDPSTGREQFSLDTSGGGGAFSFSFGNNETGTGVTTASGGGTPSLGVWYHLVGVVNLTASGGDVYLYINGVQAAETAVSANNGVKVQTSQVAIGAKESFTNPTNVYFDEQFAGSIANVALYPTALSSNQILNHYTQAIGAAPVFTESPTNTIYTQGQTGPAAFYSSASGTGTISYQWYEGTTNNPILDATNSILTLNSVTSSGTYIVMASNIIGTTNASAMLTYISGPPTVIFAPQSRVETAGDHLAFTVSALGSLPVTYQWESNGVPIASATNTAYTLTNITMAESATYAVVCANSSGTNSASATLLVTTSLQTLSSNNLIVARIGDGVQPLSSVTGNTMYLDQISPSGVYSNTIMIPDSAAPTALLSAGSAPDSQYGGTLTLSANNYYLNFGGFNATYPSTNTAGTTVNRALGAVNAYGYYQLALDAYELYYPSGNFYSAVSADGLDEFWTTGTASSVGGLKYVTTNAVKGGPPIPTINGSLTGTRVVQLFNNNLYYTDAGTNPPGFYGMTGFPTTSNMTVFNFFTDTAGSPDDFAPSPDGYTLYLCDTTNVANGGGIQRYDYNGGYSFSYALGTGAGSIVGASCLAVNFGANASWGAGKTGAIIYATTAGGSGNNLIEIVDNGPGSTATVLDTANANEILRGVRFGPVAGALPVTIVSNPQPQSVVTGGTAFFTVTASSGPFTYQWYLNSAPLTNGLSISGSGATIAGAQSAVLTVANAQLADNGGSYSVVVNNPIPGNGATSSGAPLTVTLAPVTIVTNPVSLVYVTNGGTVHLTVAATGGGMLAYQWHGPCGVLSGSSDPCGGGAVIAGATTSALTLSGVGLADSGSYYVTITNAAPSSTNTSATPSAVVVVSAPTFAANGPVTLTGGGAGQLNFSGTAGSTYRIWGSTNLSLSPITSTWTLLGNGTFVNGVNTFAIQATNTYTFFVITQP